MKKALTTIVILLLFAFSIQAVPLNDRSEVNSFDRNIMFPYSSSLDKSADIIKEYALKDNRIKYIKHP